MTQNFKTMILPKTGWRDINLKEVWQYKDLIFLFVKRNFFTRYKQTILGPVWLILSPLISTLISTFVFGTIVEIPTNGAPYFLFYMCGNTLWSYFAYCLNNTSGTFTGNAGLFRKVYFPRLVVPISTIITGLLETAVQMFMFALFWIYFRAKGADISLTWALALYPLLILQSAALGLGCGIIVSSLTTKYRDLSVVVGFGMRLWMYVTPVIYPASSLPTKLLNICMLNPMAPVMELLRYGCLGAGMCSLAYYGISLAETVIILTLGIILFSRVEKTFVDTI